MSLEVRIHKRLGTAFSLDIEFSASNAAVGILGPSGCGKSLTLRCLAGVETPDRGIIVHDGRVLFDSDGRVNLRPQLRRVGMLFQDYALFPRMDVAGNVGIGVNLPAAEKAGRIRDWLARMRIPDLGSRFPRQLSGGQRQRVALARMLAAEPRLVLLDEPFSALDSHLREQMQMEMKDILRERSEVVMVTHSRDEAYRMCDQLLVMEAGKVLRSGACREVFRHPGGRRAAELTGCKNISRAERKGRRLLFAVDWGLELATAEDIGGDIRHVGIRAHDLVPAGDGSGGNTVRPMLRGRAEDPFEWNVVFTNAGQPDAAPLWWKYSKCRGVEIPPFLRLPPEAILLLTE